MAGFYTPVLDILSVNQAIDKKNRNTKKWVQWGILSPLFISFQEFLFAFALK